RVEATIAERRVDVVRFVFADQHGILRGKTVLAAEALRALREGCTVTTTLFAKDSSHRTVYPVFSAGGGFGMPEMQGGGDALLVADPLTFRVLPWAPNNGWVLCDPYFDTGRPVPFCTRRQLRAALARLAEAGYDYVAGLELEFHVFRLEDPRLDPSDAAAPGAPGTPPAVRLLTQGYQYLTELRYDQMEPVFELLREQLVALGAPLRSMEVEFGPSQAELTFSHTTGLEAADTMVLARGAIKQILRRHGYHATFMCRPRLPNAMSSGWHLHQSLRRRDDGTNAFAPARSGATQAPGTLSALGMQFLAGLIEHGRDALALAAPTVNGYRRFRPNSLAPDRIAWGRDNRGVMLRVLGDASGAGCRIENRAGEPAANPYLYFASQVYAGLDGIERGLAPGPGADAPYEMPAPALPRSLDEALDALQASELLRDRMGGDFVDYFVHIKRGELARFHAEVSDWEQREYFDMF
ncbi:MAG: glutamine synthetase, partial [Burkholderiales bacterium]